MFCSACGHQCTDDTKFCPVCGAPFDAESQSAADPQVAPPIYSEPVRVVKPATSAQKKAAVILALVAVFALVLGIANVFCMQELPLSMSADISVPMSGMGMASLGGYAYDDYDEYYDEYDYDDYTTPTAIAPKMLELSGSVVVLDVTVGILSELSDLLDTASGGMYEFSVGGAYAGLIIFGIINLAIAFFGILYYVHIRTGKPFFFGFLNGKSPALFVGIIGAIGALGQILLMLTTGISESANGQSLTLDLSAHWSTWVALAVYLSVAGYELLRLDKHEN